MVRRQPFAYNMLYSIKTCLRVGRRCRQRPPFEVRPIISDLTHEIKVQGSFFTLRIFHQYVIQMPFLEQKPALDRGFAVIIVTSDRSLSNVNFFGKNRTFFCLSAYCGRAFFCCTLYGRTDHENLFLCLDKTPSFMQNERKEIL